MTSEIIPAVPRTRLKLPQFLGKNHIFHRQQVKRWAVMGFFVFHLEIPIDIVLCPSNDLQQLGRGDLSRGAGSRSEVTHWFYEAFPFPPVTISVGALKKILELIFWDRVRWQKALCLSWLKCDVFHNPFRISYNIQEEVSGFFIFYEIKRVKS